MAIICQVMDMLDAAERDEITHRLGFLNVCDGVHPDMTYNLDLSAYEDRKICEVSTYLSTLKVIVPTLMYGSA